MKKTINGRNYTQKIVYKDSNYKIVKFSKLLDSLEDYFVLYDRNNNKIIQSTILDIILKTIKGDTTLIKFIILLLKSFYIKGR